MVFREGLAWISLAWKASCALAARTKEPRANHLAGPMPSLMVSKRLEMGPEGVSVDISLEWVSIAAEVLVEKIPGWPVLGLMS